MKATLRVVMIGGTGATGVPTVRGLLACPQLERLTLVCRKPRTDGTFPADARLEQLPVDFAAPLDASIFAGRNANCIISCFGTTKADTASQDEYRRLEVDVPCAFARLAREAGVPHAILLSSAAASSSSWVTYLAQKGQVEDAWAALKFSTLTVLKPGLLGRGEAMRTGEKMFAWFSKPIPVETVAAAIWNRAAHVVATDAKIETPVHWENKEIYAEAARAGVEEITL